MTIKVEKKYKVFSPREPSSEFLESFVHAGGCHSVCDACGREYYCSGLGYDFEEGELEELRERSEKDPDGCIDLGDVSVGLVLIGGHSLVDACSCNALENYETLFWNHKEDIARYIRKMAEVKMTESFRDTTTAVMLERAVSDLEEREEKVADE